MQVKRLECPICEHVFASLADLGQQVDCPCCKKRFVSDRAQLVDDPSAGGKSSSAASGQHADGQQPRLRSQLPATTPAGLGNQGSPSGSTNRTHSDNSSTAELRENQTDSSAVDKQANLKIATFQTIERKRKKRARRAAAYLAFLGLLAVVAIVGVAFRFGVLNTNMFYDGQSTEQQADPKSPLKKADSKDVVEGKIPTRATDQTSSGSDVSSDANAAPAK